MQNNGNKYTFTQVSQMTGLHKNTIRNYYKKGLLTAHKEKRGGIEVLVVLEEDLYHCGVPKILERLGPQQQPHNYHNNHDKVKDTVVTVGAGGSVDALLLMERVEELNRKLGGYENATLALKAAQVERDEYRRKSLEAEERSVALKGVIADMKVEMYTPWWKRKRR
ncbi:MAG: hypothetical protein KJ686_04765 [Actinobacteria bacterium]|nr:hypothetical protein [Actinomycetota bacterium]